MSDSVGDGSKPERHSEGRNERPWRWVGFGGNGREGVGVTGFFLGKHGCLLPQFSEKRAHEEMGKTARDLGRHSQYCYSVSVHVESDGACETMKRRFPLSRQIWDCGSWERTWLDTKIWKLLKSKW